MKQRATEQEQRRAAFTAATVGSVWAILPGALATLQAGDAVVPRVGAATPRRAGQVGTVAVIPVFGVLTQRGGGWWSGTSTQEVGRQLQQALADREVAAVVLQFDSPGGEVAGTPELAAAIYAARKVKPVVASVDTLAASAAYWLAANAAEIVASPSSELGGIGVYATHLDFSRQLERDGIRVTLVSAGRHKVEGNMYEPLSLEARTALQERVNVLGSMFTADVARGRERTVASLKWPLWEGRMAGAELATLAGLADRVGTLNEAISRATARAGSGAVKQAAQAQAAALLAAVGVKR